MHQKIKNFFIYKKNMLWNVIPIILIFGILASGIFYGFSQISILSEQITLLNSELIHTNKILFKNNIQLSKNIIDLSSKTNGISEKLSGTQKNIDEVKSKVGEVRQTVGSLEKLSKIDPELLKKYSKVYFLNENYTPPHITTIPEEYVYSETRSETFLSESWPFLKRLLDSAKADGVILYVKSAYRSFDTQELLKSGYTLIYGAGTANSFSADQGYSEHQLGTTVDLITTGIGGTLSGFGETQPHQWLLDNAYKFGFINSYPKDNNYYLYEPWHWRFVGIKLATYLHNNNLHFYDMDQREIDSYLINLFD